MPEEEKKYESKGFINIDKKEKWINFGIEWDYQKNDYGKALYNNIPHILEMLGIEDKEQYELRIYGNPNHDFLKSMETKKLIAKTNSEPNTENALQIIEEFAKYPNTIRFSELNTIIEYAINSNVPMRKITEAINRNGMNIFYSDIDGISHFEKEDFEKFKSFGITGIKPSCFHHHFMSRRNFGIMKLLGDVDTKDATLEFRKIFEEVKSEYKKAKEEGTFIFPNLERYGEAEHIILDWGDVGLLIKNVSPDIQEIIREQSINKFEEFDFEHYHSWGMNLDYNSENTLTMLRDAGLMNKDTYIKLYQKALNRNYSLKEFDSIAKSFISSEERKLARKEISQNTYYPSPKNWQKSRKCGQNYEISKIEIPQNMIKRNVEAEDLKLEIFKQIKQEILNQGIARRTKIKTDMTGIGKDGKPFIVDNLKDWLLGVHGAYGNLQIMGTSNVAFPPQTPKFAVELIEQALENIEHPNADAR